MEKIKITNLSKAFGNRVIFKNFNIQFGEHKINTIIGESGIGKSTLLNILSGIETMDSGNINNLNVKDISYIFQEDRLIPWLSVNNNMRLALNCYYNDNDIQKIIDKYLELVGVFSSKFSFPKELSGGMKQRINIARALAKPSKVILMDEPFKSLDYKTKYNIMSELKKIIDNEDRIVIFVTHDVDEGIFLGGELIVFKGSPIGIKLRVKGNLEKYKNEIIECI
ncbi:MAG: ABC transporter ATP-binding protein [Clostridium sp.]